MQVRNLVVLVFCQLISATGSIVMVTLGGIIGSELASNKAFATLPLSVMVIAVAATTIPATMLMRKIGRRKSFSLASLSAVVALVVAVVALRESSFLLYNIAVMLFGINMAFTYQYRYAAAESVATKHVPRAVSLVLTGSIGAAFVGKELATRGQFWIEDIPYAGTMMVLAAMFILQALLFLTMDAAKDQSEDDVVESHRSIGEVARQPVFIVAVLGAATGFGLMTLIMTATPLSMHVNDQISLEQTASVIRAHVLGMYLPSLVTGFLIEKVGVAKLMFVGALGLFAASIIGLQGHSVLHYWWALVLLGVGWNFLYVGGTTMLTYTYSMAERYRAQAVNEFMVFGTSATASLLAGTVMHFYGWSTLMLIPIPFLIVICIALVVLRGNPQLHRDGPANA
ncbi:MAG: MFS transporter [Proteobacteria bacterium]|nr:MFS transporter [Pseudomonadota bacterium]